MSVIKSTMKRTVTLLPSDSDDKKVCTPSPPEAKKPRSKISTYERVIDDVYGFASNILTYPTNYFVKPVIVYDKKVILSHMFDKNLAKQANTELGKEVIRIKNEAIRFLVTTRDLAMKASATDAYDDLMQFRQLMWFRSLNHLEGYLWLIEDVALGILNIDTIDSIMNGCSYTRGPGTTLFVSKLSTCRKWSMDYKDFTLGSESCKMIYIRFDDEDKEYVFGATKCTKTKGGTVVERSVVEKAVVEGTNGSGNVNEIDTENV